MLLQLCARALHSHEYVTASAGKQTSSVNIRQRWRERQLGRLCVR